MSVADSSRSEDTHRARVWLVDDSDLQAELSRRALANRHSVRVFHDGATLLEELGSGDAPHLLVVDWHMPNISGLDVCKFVRETRDAATLPILVLTATGGDDVAEAFAAGANDFVLKPFSQQDLEARVTALVRNNSIHARLADAERRLRVEGEYRERFIGMLAHDLRQPLNTLILANQTIAQTVSSSPPLARLLQIERRAADRMNRMIAELLDFTRARPETGIPVVRQPMDLADVARTVVEEMRVGHPDRVLRVKADGVCTGSWDRDRVAQVCTNLIANAIEHSSSPVSPVDVVVRCEAQNVELTVINQGTPIPPDLLPVLFEPFRRGQGSKRATGGLGLGLHIVDAIVRAHGGTISVRSDATGTAFHVSLPVNPTIAR